MSALFAKKNKSIFNSSYYSRNGKRVKKDSFYYLDKARKLCIKKQYHNAISKYRQTIDIYSADGSIPELDVIYVEFANVLLKLDDIEGAKENVNLALALNNNNKDGILLLQQINNLSKNDKNVGTKAAAVSTITTLADRLSKLSFNSAGDVAIKVQALPSFFEKVVSSTTLIKSNYDDGLIENTTQLAKALSRGLSMKSIESEDGDETNNHHRNTALKIIALWVNEPNKTIENTYEMTCLAACDDEDIVLCIIDHLIQKLRDDVIMKSSFLLGLAHVFKIAKPSMISPYVMRSVLHVLTEKMNEVGIHMLHGKSELSVAQQKELSSSSLSSSVAGSENVSELFLLLRAISCLLDAMSDVSVITLDRLTLHSPLYDRLDEISKINDINVAHQAKYAKQALIKISNGETLFKQRMRRLFNVGEGLAICLSVIIEKDVSRLPDAYESFKQASKFMDQEELWHDDLRYAKFLIENHFFNKFEYFFKQVKDYHIELIHGIVLTLFELLDHNKIFNQNDKNNMNLIEKCGHDFILSILSIFIQVPRVPRISFPIFISRSNQSMLSSIDNNMSKIQVDMSCVEVITEEMNTKIENILIGINDLKENKTKIDELSKSIENVPEQVAQYLKPALIAQEEEFRNKFDDLAKQGKMEMEKQQVLLLEINSNLVKNNNINSEVNEQFQFQLLQQKQLIEDQLSGFNHLSEDLNEKFTFIPEILSKFEENGIQMNNVLNSLSDIELKIDKLLDGQNKINEIKTSLENLPESVALLLKENLNKQEEKFQLMFDEFTKSGQKRIDHQFQLLLEIKSELKENNDRNDANSEASNKDDQNQFSDIQKKRLEEHEMKMQFEMNKLAELTKKNELKIPFFDDVRFEEQGIKLDRLQQDVTHIRKDVQDIHEIASNIEHVVLKQTSQGDEILSKITKMSQELNIEQEMDSKSIVFYLKTKSLEDEVTTKELALYVPVNGSRSSRDTSKPVAMECFIYGESHLNNQTSRAAEEQNSVSEDCFLGDIQKKVLLLVGDSGIGKTTYGRYLARSMWEKFKDIEHDYIPIFLQLPAFENPQHELIESWFKSQELHLSAKQIEELKLKYKFIFILDGYDEINKRINLYDSNSLDQWNCKVVITCRREYIGSDGYQKLFAPFQGRKVIFEGLTEVFLCPFNQEQQNSYFKKAVEIGGTDWNDWEKYASVISKIPGINELCKTPFALRLVMEVLPVVWEEYRIKANNTQTSSSNTFKLTKSYIFENFIKRWFSEQAMRALKNNQGYDDIEYDYMNVSQNLAIKLHLNKLTKATYMKKKGKTSKAKSLGLSSPKNVTQTVGLFDDLFNKDDDDMRIIMEGLPIVNVGYNHQTNEEIWSFLHKSLMEYFIFSYICDSIIISNNNNDEPPVNVGHILNNCFLFEEPAIILLLAEKVQENVQFKQWLFDIIEFSKSNEGIEKASSHAITILNSANVSFSGLDFTGIKIPGANLTGGIFYNTNLYQANLIGCNLRQVNFGKANLNKTKLLNVDFGEFPSFKCPGVVRSIVYSPDGSKLASGCDNKTIQIWNTANNELLQTLRGHDDKVLSVDYSPDATRIVSASKDKTIMIWNADSGELLQTLISHTDEVLSVVYSSDGTRIASASKDQTIVLWNADSGELLQTLKCHTGDVTGVVFSPDGTLLASSSTDRTIKICNVETGKLLHTTTESDDSILSLAYSNDGTRLACGTQFKNRVMIFDAVTYEALTTCIGHTISVHTVCFSPDGSKLASGSIDSTVKIWNTINGGLLQNLSGHIYTVHCVYFSPDGTCAASSSGDSSVKVWDIENGEVLYTSLNTSTGHKSAVMCVAFCPDGSKLVSASDDRSIKVWNNDGDLLQTLSEHRKDISCIAYSNDGTEFASVSFDHTVKIWNAETYELLHSLIGHTAAICCCAYSLDGTKVASGSYDKSLKIWDSKSGELLQNFSGYEKEVRCLCFSPDGTKLTFGSDCNIVKICDAENGEILHTLKKHIGEVSSVVFSPDGLKVVSSCYRKEVIIWDALNGECIRTLRGHGNPVRSVVYLPDGLRIGSTGTDERVIIWDAVTGDKMHQYNSCGQYSKFTISKETGNLKMVTARGNALVSWNLKDMESPILEFQTSNTSLTLSGASINDVDDLSRSNRILFEQHSG